MASSSDEAPGADLWSDGEDAAGGEPSAPNPSQTQLPNASPEALRPKFTYRRFRSGDDFEQEAPGVEPSDGVPWAAATHALGEARLLTPADPRAATPPGFKGELYAPQRTLLWAMLALEGRPRLAVADAATPGRGGLVAQTRTGRIAERFSFGKTVVALALVCASRAPARLPGIAPLVVGPCQYKREANAIRGLRPTPPHWGSGACPESGAFVPEIAVLGGRPLPLTLVVAAAAVISQWEENARRFTALRVFTIGHVRELRAFEKAFRAGGAAAYDLVLLKAGRVTASFLAAGEAPALGAQGAPARSRSLLEAFAAVLDGTPVARLILDDYDVLKLTAGDCFVPALFTWLVSATRRSAAPLFRRLEPAPTLAGFFRQALPEAHPVRAAALDGVVNTAFRLSCAPAYVDAHLSSTRVGYRRIRVCGGRALGALRALGVAEEVLEMVNASAGRTAARALGLDGCSAGGVIRWALGSRLERLRLARRALARVAEARAALEAAGAAPRLESKDEERDLVRELRAMAKDGTDSQFAEALAAAGGRRPGLKAALDSLEEWAAEAEKEHEGALQRVRRELRAGACHGCKLPLEGRASAAGGQGPPRRGAGRPPRQAQDEAPAPAPRPPMAAFIFADCCQTVVCEACVAGLAAASAGGPPGQDGAPALRPPAAAAQGARPFVGRCPGCAHSAWLPAGLVRVGGEASLEAAFREGAGRGPPEQEPPPGGAGALPGAQAKLRALVQYLRGEPVDCLADAKVSPFVEGLLEGRRDSPWPPLEPRRTLVFAMHSETTHAIEAALAAAGIPACVLRGSREQKDAAVQEAQTAANVLLVTAPKDCGGIHLPWLSGVVFFHRVLDRNVEAQVAGRAQRLGREHNLEIVSLVNEAEAQGLAD